MSTKFASGKYALGICDGCGGTFKLAALKDEYVKRKPKGVRKCDDCRDPDHPQNMFGERTPVDAQALRNPRPDTSVGPTGNVRLSENGTQRLTELNEVRITES